MPLASIIIPNWNGIHHLPGCLDALRAQTYSHTEVILVDNGSTDGSQAFVTEHYPEVHLLELERNLGLTGGNNIGFDAAGGEILISLNNDTEAHPRFVEALVTALIEHPEAGMAAAKMLLFDRRDHIHSAGDGYGKMASRSTVVCGSETRASSTSQAGSLAVVAAPWPTVAPCSTK